MGAKLKQRCPLRDAKCRICDKQIPAGLPALVMYGVSVSPRMVNLWFHGDCLASKVIAASLEELHEDDMA